MNLVLVNAATGEVTFNVAALLEPFVQALLWAAVAGLLVFILVFGVGMLLRYLRALSFHVKLYRRL